MAKQAPKINYKFRIPFAELCPKCKAVILQRKKEQKRLNNRKFMALFRFQKNQAGK